MKSSRRFVDYSAETKIAKNPLLRYVWLVLGFVFTGLGFLGYMLPVMPGTVFILVAVYFFARSSPRFYNWLLNNPYFGELIRDWRAGKGLSKRVKISAVAVIAITISISILLVSMLWVKVIVAMCGIGVSWFLISRPTKI